MNGSWSSNLALKTDWPGNGNAAVQSLETYKQSVAGISAEVVMWNGGSLSASFYLRLASAQGTGRETLGERLNDPAARFVPCKIDDRVELLSLRWISFIRIAAGHLPEVVRREEVGAVRQPARVTVESGYVLDGEFLYVLPTARARLSDLLNVSSERFLLFLAPAAAFYINRDAVVRIVP